MIESIIAGLRGEQLVPADARATIVRSLPHGHVAAVSGQAAKLGLPAMLGPASPARDLVMALIIARVCRPGSDRRAHKRHVFACSHIEKCVSYCLRIETPCAIRMHLATCWVADNSGADGGCSDHQRRLVHLR